MKKARNEKSLANERLAERGMLEEVKDRNRNLKLWLHHPTKPTVTAQAPKVSGSLECLSCSRNDHAFQVLAEGYFPPTRYKTS